MVVDKRKRKFRSEHVAQRLRCGGAAQQEEPDQARQARVVGTCRQNDTRLTAVERLGRLRAKVGRDALGAETRRIEFCGKRLSNCGKVRGEIIWGSHAKTPAVRGGYSSWSMIAGELDRSFSAESSAVRCCCASICCSWRATAGLYTFF